jgi:hypothetical protein
MPESMSDTEEEGRSLKAEQETHVCDPQPTSLHTSGKNRSPYDRKMAFHYATVLREQNYGPLVPEGVIR